METCQIEGCPRPVSVHSRGLCKLHYSRWWRTGDPGEAEPRRIYGDATDRWRHLYRVDQSGCWIWTGSLDKGGYGQISVYADGRRKNWRAHRWVYTRLIRTLGDEETLDHLCRVHACVNPEHLDPVPLAVNISRGLAGRGKPRKARCKHGHPFDEKNAYISASGRRICRTCQDKRNKESWLARRTGAPRNGEKTHCKHGHEFTPENTITRRSKAGVSHRQCRECTRAAVRDYMRRMRAGTDS